MPREALHLGDDPCDGRHSRNPPRHRGNVKTLIDIVSPDKSFHGAPELLHLLKFLLELNRSLVIWRALKSLLTISPGKANVA